LLNDVLLEMISKRPNGDGDAYWGDGSGESVIGNLGIDPATGRIVLAQSKAGKVLTTIDDLGCIYGSDNRPIVNSVVIAPIEAGNEWLPGDRVVDGATGSAFYKWHRARNPERPATADDVEEFLAVDRPVGPLRVIEGGGDPPAA
jgi:hypothetical protein